MVIDQVIKLDLGDRRTGSFVTKFGLSPPDCPTRNVLKAQSANSDLDVKVG